MIYRYLCKFLTLFYGISFSFFWDFNESSSRKADLQLVVLKSEEKFMENVYDSDQF